MGIHWNPLFAVQSFAELAHEVQFGQTFPRKPILLGFGHRPVWPNLYFACDEGKMKQVDGRRDAVYQRQRKGR
jgi:hypothetical protein